MKSLLFIIISFGFCFLAYAGGKVYTDDDLEHFKSDADEATYKYNQRVMQKNRQEVDRQNTEIDHKGQLQEAADEQNRKRDAARRIDSLERDKAQEKLEEMNELKVGGFVGKRRAEQRQDREIQREQDLDQAYRGAGLSRERELQRRTAEAEAKKKEADIRAAEAEERATESERKASRAGDDGIRSSDSFYDTKSRAWKTCSGGICY
jgi:hypothetical protein